MWFKYLVVIAGTYFITSLMWIERSSKLLKESNIKQGELRGIDSLKHSQEIDSLKEVIQGFKM